MIFVFMVLFILFFIVERGGKLYYINVFECLVLMFVGFGINLFKLFYLLWKMR